MKIVEWNCQGAFRNKNEQILKYNPDILIIPECENQERLKFGSLTPKPNDFFWYGDNANKGIGVFSYSDYKFELLKEFNPNFRYVIPLKVTNRDETFLLFAIWAMDNKQNPSARYIGQVWLAINYYSKLLDYNSILLGDFNSNQIWDTKERIGNHTDVVNNLKNKGIYSLYHAKSMSEHGKEMDHTYFMHRNFAKPYHIDYCFASKHFLENFYNLTLGDCNDWISQSDHVPMIIELNHIPQIIDIENSLENSLKGKFSNLSKFTEEEFKEVISAMLIRANKTDTAVLSEKNKIERNEIIETSQKIIEIDKLVTEIKNLD